MTDAQKRELFELWRKTPYLTYYETLSLLAGCLPNTNRTVKFSEEESIKERFELIKRILTDSIQKFELKVYFWTTFVYDGEIPLDKPDFVTADTLDCFVPPPPENYSSFWLFGKLSSKELREWLQDKGIASSFFETTVNPIPEQKNAQKPEIQQAEITQEEAAVLAGVTSRTIRDWDKGISTPKGYPGRQSRAVFMVHPVRAYFAS